MMRELLAEQINVRMPPSAAAVIKEAADREYISPGAYIRRILMRELGPELNKLRSSPPSPEAAER
jgi:hypothetical protein